MFYKRCLSFTRVNWVLPELFEVYQSWLEFIKIDWGLPELIRSIPKLIDSWLGFYKRLLEVLPDLVEVYKI